MEREDGRKNSQHRSISMEVGKNIVFSFGLTKVYAMLEYSAQLKKGITASVIMEENAFPSSVSKKRIERLVEEAQKAIESIFSNLLLDKENSYRIVCKVLCDNGSLLSAIINSASLVLLAHKVPIKHLVFSVTIGLSQERHAEYVVDLNESEERTDMAYITIATGAVEYDTIISYGSISKPISEKAFLDLLEYSASTSKDISKEIMEKAKQCLA
ncbi:hypothetical protein NEPAR04_2346 [Nematocida parisii]|nr:hypothetical protein NEPAR08_2011 [Nematocida parisii]KAI5145152.1 hypothetical protein NEPAR04_2346 [Nematocida parisii]